MNYYERYIDLSTNYKQDTDTYIKETNVEIKFFQFNSVLNESNNVLLEKDNNIIETELSSTLYLYLAKRKEKDIEEQLFYCTV